MIRAVAILVLVTLAACGPVSPERVADQCQERARAATGPTGTIGVGVNSQRGGVINGNITITSDFITGRDPYEVYDSCVRARTGQGPVRPLDLG